MVLRIYFYNFCRFLTDIYSEAHPGPSLRLKKTVQVLIPSKPFQPVTCPFQVETHRVLLREGAGVNLTLTIGSGTSPWMMKWKTGRTKRLFMSTFQWTRLALVTQWTTQVAGNQSSTTSSLSTRLS